MEEAEKQSLVGSNPVKLGIIGSGFIGQLAHLMNYVEVQNCTIVALAEIRPELRRKVAERYGIPRTYANHQELLEDPDVEAIVAVTTRGMTGPIALDCLKHGKSLLTEKPMASTLVQAKKLVETARSQGVATYSVGFMRRYDAGVVKAKLLLDELQNSGELGPIVYTRAHCFAGDGYRNCDGHIVTEEDKPENRESWPIAPDWVPQETKMEYHQYLNLYCHKINLLRFLFDRSPSVSYVRLDRPGGRIAMFDFGDHTAILETGQLLHQGWDEVIEIYFAKGRLRIETPPALFRNAPAKIELYKGGNINQTLTPHCEWRWAFRLQAEAFIADVQNKRESIASGTDSLEDIRLIEKMWKMEIKQRYYS
jgi:predicted dehydrogenase